MVPVGIDIKSKKNSIGQQAQCADGSNEFIGVNEDVKKFCKAYGRIFQKVNDNKTEEGPEKSKNNTQFQVISFQDKCCHDFSSLDFKT